MNFFVFIYLTKVKLKINGFGNKHSIIGLSGPRELAKREIRLTPSQDVTLTFVLMLLYMPHINQVAQTLLRISICGLYWVLIRCLIKDR